MRQGIVALVMACGSLLAREASATYSCAITTASGINFGNYDMMATSANTAAGSVKVTCTGYSALSTFTLDLDKGSSGSYSGRTMKLGLVALNYNIYWDPVHTLIFGDNSPGTTHATGTPSLSGGIVTVSLYGSILAQQSVTAGTYSDTITATVNY